MSVVFGGILGACSSSSTTPSIVDGGRVDAPLDGGNGGDATPGDALTGDSGGRDAPDGNIDVLGLPDAATGEASADASDSGTIPDGTADATLDATADAAPSGPQRLLVTFGAATTSETVAVNVATGVVDGRLGFTGFGVTDARNAASMYLLEQNADVVAKLDVAKPWQIDSTWGLSLADVVDGGSLYSDAIQVVPVSAAKAYVLRYDRNAIAVIDPSATTDGGAPSASIDLSGFLQTGDQDGVVEMTDAAYVSSANRLYVVLANVNQVTAATYGAVVCTGEASTLVAIDTLTDKVVSLGGTGTMGSIPLTHYNPSSVVYDAALGRLLVVGAGCYAKPAGSGTVVGAASLRGVDSFVIATGKVTSLLDLDTAVFPAGFVDQPSGFAYIDATHAILGFDQTGQAVYAWDPTKTVIGAVIPNAPDVFTYDGNGHLLGARQDVSTLNVKSMSIVSVAVATGVSTTLASNVTSLVGTTYVASVDVWPHP